MKNTFLTALTALVLSFSSHAQLWLEYNVNRNVWPHVAEFKPMEEKTDGVYTVRLNASELNFSDGYSPVVFTSDNSEIWVEKSYRVNWGLKDKVDAFDTSMQLIYGNGNDVKISEALSGEMLFTLDTTGGDGAELLVSQAPQYEVGVSYDGGDAQPLSGSKEWSGSFTLTDNTVRTLLFNINGINYGGPAWSGSDIILEAGSEAVAVAGPGVFAFTLTAEGDDPTFRLAISKQTYVPPVEATISCGGGDAITLAGTNGPWSHNFVIPTAATWPIAITLNGTPYGGAVWTGSDIELEAGAAPVQIQGPGIFGATISRDGDGFKLAISKQEYVSPVTSLSINDLTIIQNSEQNSIYNFKPMLLSAGQAVSITDNEGNVYCAPNPAALNTGRYTLTATSSGKSNLTAAENLNYIFTATITGRTLQLDVVASAPSATTVPQALLDNWDGSYTPENKTTIWLTHNGYNENLETDGKADVGHYGHWKDIFLIGNGRFGASVIGGASESIVIADKTDFSASLDTDNKFEGWQGGFHGMGTLSINRNSPNCGWNTGQLVRQLDMATGVVTYARHSDDGQTYSTHQYLCSGPYDVLGMSFSANEGQTMSYSFSLGDLADAIDMGAGYMCVAGGTSNVVEAAIVARVVTDGTVSGTAKSVNVDGATYIYIICGAGTNYEMNGTTYTNGQTAAELAASIRTTVDTAADLVATEGGWNEFYTRSVADHARLFGAMEFDLADAVNDVPTDVLLAEYKEQTIGSEAATSTPRTRMFDVLLAQMGRYIAIASSRGDNTNQPSNLQGTWAEVSDAPWLGDYHCNINLQMNYWPAEPTGLGETHMPLMRYMKHFASGKWREYARHLGGEGWTHAMGLSPFGSSYEYNGAYPEGAGWNATHIWQHYLFTQDRDFLAEYFDTLYGCCRFLAGYTTSHDGSTVIKSYYSPEQGSGNGPAVHATQIAYHLIDATRKAALILGRDSEATQLQQWQDAMHTGIEIGSNGLWCEWFGTDTRDGDDHRHLSHLMSLYPFDKVDAYEGDPDLYESALATVLARGDSDGGEKSIWCTAWKMACFARLQQGDLALRQLACGIIEKEGIYADLRVGCKGTFQIDGSCGISGAVPEMLLQSHRSSMLPDDTYGQLDVLPALPSAWDEGSVKGLRAAGNFSVDIDWAGGNAESVSITSGSGLPLRVQLADLRDGYSLYYNGKNITKLITDASRHAAPGAAASSAKYSYSSAHGLSISATAPGDVIELRRGKVIVSTGIDEIAEDEILDDGPATYFNLQGIPVANPQPGCIYIRRTARTAAKIRY